jgi:hypothetical protein
MGGVMTILFRIVPQLAILLAAFASLSACADISVLAALKAAQAKAGILQAQWARTLTIDSASSGAVFDSVALDSSGNIYAVGHQGGTGTFGFGNGVTSVGTSPTDNVLMVKYDSFGQAQWARTLTSGADQAGYYGVTVDAFNVIHTTGLIGSGTFGFGNSIVTTGSNAVGNVLWVRYNPAGQPVGALSLTSGSNYASFSGVAPDETGFNVYAVGAMNGSGTFGFGNSIFATGTASAINPLLVKYNVGGSATLARTLISGAGGAFYSGLAIDSAGNVYAAGGTNDAGTYTFDPGVSATGTSPSGNVLLVKYNSSGQAIWARSLTAGGSYASFSAVAVDQFGNIYAVGSVSGTGTYGFGNGVSATGTSNAGNIVLVKYNSGGQALWAQSLTTGSKDSNLTGVTTDPSGNVYVVGSAQGSSTYGFGNGVTAQGTSSIGYNLLLLKYDSAGNAIWAQTVSAGTGYSDFSGLAMDSNGSLFAVGMMLGAGTFAFGNGVSATGSSTGFNVLLVKYSR